MSPKKLIAFDDETFNALVLLSRDRMETIQELAEEAFNDVLKKHGRPVELREALRKSAKPREHATEKKVARSKRARR